MPVNIVDLGIVYGVSLEDGVATVKLTFTAMGCPASDLILQDIESRLLREPGVRAVRVDVVGIRPGPHAGSPPRAGTRCSFGVSRYERSRPRLGTGSSSASTTMCRRTRSSPARPASNRSARSAAWWPPTPISPPPTRAPPTTRSAG